MAFIDRFIPCQRRYFNRRIFKFIVTVLLVSSVINVIANGANVYFHTVSRIDRAELHRQQDQTDKLAESLNRLRGSRGRIQSIDLNARLQRRELTDAEIKEIQQMVDEAEYVLSGK
jgi:outer membrane protein TolC